MSWNVVIVGGGFGGFYAAKTLEKTLPHHSARVTLISNDNFLLYSPLLPGAAAGTLEPRHVVHSFAHGRAGMIAAGRQAAATR